MADPCVALGHAPHIRMYVHTYVHTVTEHTMYMRVYMCMRVTVNKSRTILQPCWLQYPVYHLHTKHLLLRSTRFPLNCDLWTQLRHHMVLCHVSPRWLTTTFSAPTLSCTTNVYANVRTYVCTYVWTVCTLTLSNTRPTMSCRSRLRVPQCKEHMLTRGQLPATAARLEHQSDHTMQCTHSMHNLPVVHIVVNKQYLICTLYRRKTLYVAHLVPSGGHRVTFTRPQQKVHSACLLAVLGSLLCQCKTHTHTHTRTRTHTTTVTITSHTPQCHSLPPPTPDTPPHTTTHHYTPHTHYLVQVHCYVVMINWQVIGLIAQH